ncbi:MAG: response regulator transcription factor [Proteobacteria bacterium]|nr:MAG: response regulator transcription factor [Pseudomonadota bacterium]
MPRWVKSRILTTPACLAAVASASCNSARFAGLISSIRPLALPASPPCSPSPSSAVALANSGNMAAAEKNIDAVIRCLAPIGLTRILLEELPFVRLLEQLNSTQDGAFNSLPPEVSNYVEKVATSTNRYISNEADEIQAICDSLTDREIEILAKLAQGMSNKIIGAHIFVSENTVKYHLRSIFSKLRVRNRTEATNVAVRYRII